MYQFFNETAVAVYEGLTDTYKSARDFLLLLLGKDGKFRFETRGWSVTVTQDGPNLWSYIAIRPLRWGNTTEFRHGIVEASSWEDARTEIYARMRKRWG